MGDGKIVRFWKDKWYENDALCDSFPFLDALAATKKAWSAEVWDSMGDSMGE